MRILYFIIGIIYILVLAPLYVSSALLQLQLAQSDIATVSVLTSADTTITTSIIDIFSNLDVKIGLLLILNAVVLIIIGTMLFLKKDKPWKGFLVAAGLVAWVAVEAVCQMSGVQLSATILIPALISSHESIGQIGGITLLAGVTIIFAVGFHYSISAISRNEIHPVESI